MTSKHYMRLRARLFPRCFALLVIPLIVSGCVTTETKQAGGYTDLPTIASYNPAVQPPVQKPILADTQSASDAIRVAVVDFSSANGSPFTSCSVTVTPLNKAGEKLSEEIATRLGQRPEYEIIEPNVVREAIQSNKLYKRGLDKPSTLRKLAFLVGADAVVMGHTEGSRWAGKGHKGASLFASIRMVATNREETLWALDACVSNTKSERNIVPELADDMMQQLIVKSEEQRVAKLLALRDSNL